MISNRDTRSMAAIDRWAERIPIEKVLPLFGDEEEDSASTQFPQIQINDPS